MRAGGRRPRTQPEGCQTDSDVSCVPCNRAACRRQVSEQRSIISPGRSVGRSVVFADRADRLVERRMRHLQSIYRILPTQ